MANFNNPSMGIPPQNNINVGMNSQNFPYGNSSSNLINNSPYDNYMGRLNNSLNLQNQNQYQYQFKGRPVSSKEEARAAQIDFDGSLWIFTDIGNGKIYTKQINNDGTATFKTYAFTEDENPYASTEFVTKEEFNKVIQSLMAAIPIPAQTEKAKETTSEQTKATINF